MAALDDWLNLTTKLLEGGVAVITTGAVNLSDESKSHPKVLSLLLLARTLSHVKGIRMLAKVGRTLEARILVRNCFENSFWVGKLAKDGQKFVAEILEDEKKRRNAKGQLLFDQRLEFEEDVDKKLRQWMKDHKSWSKSATLTPKGVAKETATEKTYVFYSELSDDAHPSTDTLARHLLPDDEHDNPGIDLEPPLKMDELIEPLRLNACAVLSVLFGVNEVMEAEASPMLTELANEYLLLQEQIAKR
jgi:hypothetical protein